MITDTPTSAFARYEHEAFPYRFRARLHLESVAGGTPTDPNVAEGWLRSKLSAPDDVIRSAVAETMVERGVTAEEAAELVNDSRNLSGFKRDQNGLYIEGRQVKAGLKEAASVAVAAGKLNARGWGTTNKGLLSYLAEHVFVVEEHIHLGVTEPTRVSQSFLHKMTPRGPVSAIQYNEVVEDADIEFTVTTDHDFSERDWAMIWLTGGQQGLGAARSQGFGRYTVTLWEPLA